MAKPIRLAIGVAVALLLALYPILVYFGLNHIQPRWMALLLLIVASIRFFVVKLPRKLLWGWLLAIVAATAITFISGSEDGLLFYPVLVNATLLTLFMASYFWPPSMIERLARLKEPDLPAAGVAYTRKATLAWAGFFAVNGSIAAVTTQLDIYWWTLYNGLLSYFLIAVFMGAEYLVRKRSQRQQLAFDQEKRINEGQ